MSILTGRRHDLQHYEYKKIPAKMLADFLDAAEAIVPYYFADISLALIGLECFCQLYDNEIFLNPNQSSANRLVVERYCALVFQRKIFLRSRRGCMLLARYFLRCANSLNYFEVSLLEFSQSATSPQLEVLLEEVEQLTPDQELLEFWKGWPSVSASGSQRYFPLQAVFLNCGREFTRNLYRTMDEFFRTRQRGLHGTWQEFVDAIAELGALGEVENLKSPQSSLEFFKALLLRFLTAAKNSEEPINYATAAIEWRNHFQTYVMDYLVPSGLVAKPTGGFPMPRGERIAGANTHVRTGQDGQDVKLKLLTEVPLQVTDRRAIELLFDDINQDIRWIRLWAEHVANFTWACASRREKLGRSGTALALPGTSNSASESNAHTKAWCRSRENPFALNNIAATFSAHGYLTQEDTSLELLYEDRLLAARELGMPSTKVILAFCALLIIEHPALTRSALLSLNLFDKNGSLVGVNEIEGHSYLTSFKRRAGVLNAQKSIRLNPCSEELVQRLIQITQPLREYLRERQDDNWRRLILISGHTFAYPKSIKRDEVSYRPELRRAFRQDMREIGAPDAVTEHLANVFTLTRLRASVGVAEYIRTTSVSAMANVLGHKEYKKALINHYLPEPLRRFFEERWVRIFQLGIICEVMKESEYLVEASGFKSVEELDEFLRNHVITFPDAYQNLETPKDETSRLVVNVNPGVLRLFCALSMVSEDEAKDQGRTFCSWRQVSEKLLAYIQSSEFPNPEIQKMLEEVYPSATPAIIGCFLP